MQVYKALRQGVQPVAVKKITQADDWQMTQFIKVHCLHLWFSIFSIDVLGLCPVLVCLLGHFDLSSCDKPDIPT